MERSDRRENPSFRVERETRILLFIMQRIIWWLRRDLRLTDNVTLHYALRDASSIIPVFILNPRLLGSDKLAPARKQFLFDSLADIDARLRERGGRLNSRTGVCTLEIHSRAVDNTR